MAEYEWELVKDFVPETYPGVVQLEMLDDEKNVHTVMVDVHSDTLIYVSANGHAVLIIETGRRRGGGDGLHLSR